MPASCYNLDEGIGVSDYLGDYLANCQQGVDRHSER